MQTVKLDMYQALAIAVIMLLIGRELVARIEFLRRYCIPAPVVGGLVFAIVHAVLRAAPASWSSTWMSPCRRSS